MASSLHLHRNLALASAASFLVGASSVQCGSSGSSNSSSGTFNTGGNGSGTSSAMGGSSSTLSGPTGSGGQVSFFDAQTKDYSAEDFFNTDPPPMSCDGGGVPPVVTGTPECPSDKNNPGCPCPTSGATAPCWTGPRKNRDHGFCKDGTTTCKPSGETAQLEWGDCSGEVLPVMGATGKAACECFSKGLWKIDNLSPCFVTDQAMTTVMEGISTDTTGMCPSDFTTPPTDWSTDTLTVDCAGSFTLCYTIKAGNAKTPMPTDCTVGQSCVTADYTMVNQPQVLMDLPGWITDSSMTACAQQFFDTGGYGEMSVNGQSNECELVNKVFQRVPYCPITCNSNPTAPGCAGCMNGGSGTF